MNYSIKHIKIKLFYSFQAQAVLQRLVKLKFKTKFYKNYHQAKEY